MVRQRLAQRQILPLVDEALANVLLLQLLNIGCTPDQGRILAQGQTESSPHDRQFAVDCGIGGGLAAAQLDVLPDLMGREA